MGLECATLSLLLSSPWISKEHVLVVVVVSQNPSKLTYKNKSKNQRVVIRQKGTKSICPKTRFLDISNNNSIMAKRK